MEQIQKLLIDFVTINRYINLKLNVSCTEFFDSIAGFDDQKFRYRKHDAQKTGKVKAGATGEK